MLTRCLGGDSAHRGLFGARRDRARTTGLIVVAVVGMAATICRPVPGVVLTALAAGAVHVGTAFTHNGSVAARLAARRRWRARTSAGELTFTPGVHVPVLPAPRKGQVGRPEVIEAVPVNPVGVAGFAWLHGPVPQAPGIVWHTPPGARAFLSCAFTVDGAITGSASDAGVDAAAVAFGDLLARHASTAVLPDRLQVLTRMAPLDPGAHLAWLAANLDPEADPALAASWREVIADACAQGLTGRHLVVARWPLTAAFTDAAARHGVGREGWKTLMEHEITTLADRLHCAGLGHARALTVAATAGWLRHLQHPSWAIEDTDGLDCSAPWLAATEEWSAVCTTGPDPDGQLVSWWTRTAVVPVDALGTTARPPTWLGPLLWDCPDPVLRTICVQLAPVPAAAARHTARVDLTADLADLHAAAERGTLADDELAVGATAAHERVADLAPGSGHHGLTWAAHLSLTAPTRSELATACSRVSEAAAAAGIARLAWADTHQGPAAAACWPLARGMREPRTGPATALRDLLAGHAPKESM